MGQENYITKSRKGKHLNYEERIKIEALYRSGLRPSAICLQLGRSKRTIERELSKGMADQVTSELIPYTTYSADAGQREYDHRATAKGPALKIGKDHKLVSYIEESIKSGNSLYATLQNIQNKGLQFGTIICVRTLYTYIDDRQEIGHWEMDCVVGKQGTKTALLVLSERALRKELIFKLTSKTQNNVIKVLDGLERKMGRVKFSETFKNITTDNGCEFLNFEGIEKSLFAKKKKRTQIYYAHPYSAWERGTNENINKMIRRFIPKGVNIGKFSDGDLQRIEAFINDYTRKILNGLSANMAIKKLFAEISTVPS